MKRMKQKEMKCHEKRRGERKRGIRKRWRKQAGDREKKRTVGDLRTAKLSTGGYRFVKERERETERLQLHSGTTILRAALAAARTTVASE